MGDKSQPKCHLGMEKSDYSLRQHKRSPRNQNYRGIHFVHVLFGAQAIVLVGVPKPWLIGQHNF
jgi:hypothetical protein